MAVPPEPLMRRVVLYVDSLKIGGVERVTLTFARWLRQNGWTPIVLTRQHAPSISIRFPPGWSGRWSPRSPVAALAWPLGFPWRVRRLRHWLRQQQVSLAIGMTTKPAVKLLLAAHPLRIPCAVSERNFPPLKPMALPGGAAAVQLPLGLVAHRADPRHRRVAKQELSAEPQLLLPNPVQWPLPRFDPELDPDQWLTEVGVASDAPVLLAAGTKVHQKGLICWCRRLQIDSPSSQSSARHPWATQEPYHGSDQQKALRRLLRRDPEDRHNCISLVGWGTWRIGTDAARCLCCPLDTKGSPMCCWRRWQRAAVVWRPTAPWTADLLRHNTDGLLLPRQATATRWSEAIDRLLQDPQQRQRLEGEAATVRERFSDRALEAQLMQALGQLD